MGVYKRNNKYWICYWHDKIRYRESGGRTKREAETALAIRKSEIANSKFGIKNGKKIKFSDFSKVYMSNHGNSKASKETFELHIRNIQRFFGDILIDSFRPLEVEKYKRYRMIDGGVSRATVNRELSCLRGMLNKAVEWEYLKESPIKKFGLFKEDNQRKRYLTQEEYRRLLYCCAEHLKPIVIFAANTGMRRGEVLNLKWDEVDFDNGLLYVNKTKNRERRVVPMNQTVRGLLSQLDRSMKSEYIFCNEQGQKIKSVRTGFTAALRRAGIKDFKWHDLRHTAASHLIMAGADIMTVKEILGHKTLEMTMRYSHLSQDHKTKAIELLDNQLATKTATL